MDSLLEALDRSGSRWESPALGLRLASVTTLTNPASHVGTSVGPYRLVRLIAQGGMGAVFEGERADEQFHKRVAVKLLRRGADSDLAIRRFQHEREILASLEHRNIASLVDGGVLPDGQPYFIRECVDGVPITEFADRERLTIHDRVVLMRQVCRAVEHAHAHLVVHRDLKPSNILVTTDGTVKLLDFGIAKLLSSEPGSASLPVTQSHERAMTLEYASPEQLRGSTVATASDVYSLGVVLYELLTGRRPFDGGGETMLDLARHITDDAPLAPSSAVDPLAVAPRGAPSLPALQRELRGDLDSVVLMALRKEPSRRYASADRLSRDLVAWLEHHPVSARTDTMGYRFRKFVGRHRWQVAAAALLLATLVGGSATTYWQARRADARYRDGRRLANALVSDVHNAIADMPGSTAARAALIRPALDYLDRTAHDVGSDPVLDRELAFAYQRIGDVQGNPTNANLGDLVGARASYSKTLQIAERLYGRTPVDESSARLLAQVMERLADVTGPNDEVQLAAGYQRRAMEVYQRIARDWPSPEATHQLAVSKLKLGDVSGHPAFRNLGDTALAMRLYAEALTLLEHGAPAATDRFRSTRYRAILFERMGRIAQDGNAPNAAPLLEQSLALRIELAGARPGSVDVQRDVAIAHFLLCGLRLTQGALAQAAASCDASLKVRETLFRADPTNAQLVRGMGLIYRRLGDIALEQRRAADAASRYRVALAFFDTLFQRKAASKSDEADRRALQSALAGSVR